MWQRLRDWLHDRLGYRELMHILTLDISRLGQPWRFVWASALSCVLIVLVVTGIMLMLVYSPGVSTAWGSVYYLQYEMHFGWLIRALHHFAAQVFLVLLAAYLLFLVFVGLHLPPGEVVWWTALLLLAVAFANDVTGNPLPWDQKGYWALHVELNIVGGIPGLGSAVRQWVQAGNEAGQLTLTRLYTLHVFILPAITALLLLGHRLALRRYLQRATTITVSSLPSSLAGGHKVLARLVVLSILLGLCFTRNAVPLGITSETSASQPDAMTASEMTWWQRFAWLGRWGVGALLEAPADPSRDYPIARPKWTYWFLFELRQSLEGPWAAWATVFGPVIVFLVLFLLPLAGRGRARQPIYVLSVVLIISLAIAVSFLIARTWWKDYGPTETAEKFRAEVHQQRQLAQRAIILAFQGIPAEGAAELLRRDPLTRGRELYRTHCASCHAFGMTIPASNPVAPDLENFAKPDWIYRLLQNMRDEKSIESQVLPQMASWLRREYDRAARADEKERMAGVTPQAVAKLEEDLRLIAEWLASHPRRPVPSEGPERETFDKDPSLFARGYRAFEARCLRCHPYNGLGGGDTKGPDFTGYGDADWLRGLLHAPFEMSYYGPSMVRWSRNPIKRAWMPAFRDTESTNAALWQRDLERLLQQLQERVPEDDPKREERWQVLRQACTWLPLSELDRELIIRFVLGDGRLVFGGPSVAP
ncbi:MAG: cytochrome b N-terminal domain-containing protein [Gemmatales bacterium]|nr:cytochrome b N-terminal domain-containing protein [Gemmatales bacterium]MDW7994341.1 cytochrome b N-terminal domain-containing protein [Gemmatales bacterium]